MSLQSLASKIAKKEGLKKEVSIGNIREIIRCLVDLEREFRESDGQAGYSPADLIIEASEKKKRK